MARPVGCLPCGPRFTGHPPASTRSTRPTAICSTRPAPGLPTGSWRWPTTRRAGRGRLDRRWESPPGANLLVSVLLRPELRGGDAAPVHGGGGPGRGRGLPRGRPGSSRCSSGPTTCWSGGAQAGRGPGRGGVRRRDACAARRGRASGSTCLARARRTSGARCLDDVGWRRSRWTAGALLDALLGALEPRCAAARRGGRAGASWPTSCAGAAPRSGQPVRVELAGEDVRRAWPIDIDDAGPPGRRDGGCGRSRGDVSRAGDVVPRCGLRTSGHRAGRYAGLG